MSRLSSSSSTTTTSVNNTQSQHFTRHNIPCKYYSSGKCVYGSECRFLHIEKNGTLVNGYNDADEYFNEGVNLSNNDAMMMMMHWSNNNNNSNNSFNNNNNSRLAFLNHNRSGGDNDEVSFTSHTNQNNNNNNYNNTNNNNNNGSIVAMLPRYKSLDRIKRGLDPVSLILLGRRPLLHIVVLFAEDTKVRSYLDDVQETFLSHGMNVYAQLTTIHDGSDHEEGDENENENSDVGAMIGKWEPIRPNHLQEIITNSTADYLVVIGDRNMKHRTCHAKKSGKLVEVTVSERAETIMSEWSQMAQNGKNLSNLMDKASEFTREQIQEFIQLLTQARHVQDRLTRLRENVNELREWRAPKHSKLDHHVPVDEKMLTRLTTAQNAAIRLHKDMSSAFTAIKNIRVDESNAADSNRGLLLNIATFDQNQIGISQSLKEQLVVECEDLISKIERFGSQLSEVANNNSLWEAYRTEQARQREGGVRQNMVMTNIAPSPGVVVVKKKHKKKEAQKMVGMSSITANGCWTCKKCTFLNAPVVDACEICFSVRLVEGEWSVNTSKKTRGKPREESIVVSTSATSSSIAIQRPAITKTQTSSKTKNISTTSTSSMDTLKQSNQSRTTHTDNPWHIDTKPMTANKTPTILQKPKNTAEQFNFISVVGDVVTDVITSSANNSSSSSNVEPSLSYDVEYPSLNGKKTKQKASNPSRSTAPQVGATSLSIDSTSSTQSEQYRSSPSNENNVTIFERHHIDSETNDEEATTIQHMQQLSMYNNIQDNQQAYASTNQVQAEYDPLHSSNAFTYNQQFANINRGFNPAISDIWSPSTGTPTSFHNTSFVPMHTTENVNNSSKHFVGQQQQQPVENTLISNPQVPQQQQNIQPFAGGPGLFYHTGSMWSLPHDNNHHPSNPYSPYAASAGGQWTGFSPSFYHPMQQPGQQWQHHPSGQTLRDAPSTQESFNGQNWGQTSGHNPW